MSELRRDEITTRQERREQRLEKKKEKMPQHSRGLGRVYKEAILKRINQLRGNKDKRQRIEEQKTP
jgi:hypothetical protein